MNTSGMNNYWPEQDANQTIKSHLKFPVNSQLTSNYNEMLRYYGETNNNNNNNNTNTNANPQIKRTYSNSDRQVSPLKKRQYVPQVSYSLPSSADHSDDDDDDDDDESDLLNANMSNGAMEKSSEIKRDDNRRRAAHTAAEQKRRNAIRKGYDALQSLVPNSHLLDPISSQKVSKAAILKRSTDYLMELNKEKQQLNTQLEEKRKDTYCLRAVQKTYEDILEMNLKSSKNASATIDDEQKFKVFQNIADGLFLSFDQAMQVEQITNFSQFTSAMLRWVEDSCRPLDINDIIRRVIGHSKS
ncbi:unnamed protein product [Adineta steineri]|uniref:BHLH domain-containing protein n=2 Tax=Adineta steineri TaxID=433720 RepID=A0A813Q7J7_9BILA|nr:unnamed protein product [Adineta steineri]CAF1284074.1 unnamed protein product [Adineta steineri]